MKIPKRLISVAENIGLFLIVLGLLGTTFIRTKISGVINLWGYLFLVLFGLLYIRYYSLYAKQNRLKFFFRFHLIGLLLGLVVAILSPFLTQFLILFLMSGTDYGVPMVAGLIAGLFFILFFPLIFLGLYTLGLFLLCRRFIKGVSLSEASRLSFLGLGVFMTISWFLSPGTPSPSPPPLLAGPPITLRILPSSQGYHLYGVLPWKNLKGLEPRRILLLPHLHTKTPTREELVKAKSYYLESTALAKGLFVETVLPVKSLPKPYLVVYTLEKRAFGGESEGPILYFPVHPHRVANFFEFQKAFWERGSHPALYIILEASVPVEPSEACFNFHGDLTLKTSSGAGFREIYFQGGPFYYRRLKGEEFLCYFLRPLTSRKASGVGYLVAPEDLKASPHLLGPITLKFSVGKEAYRALARKGFYRTEGRSLPAKFLLVASPRLFYLREKGRLSSPVFKLEIPQPR